MSSLADLEQLEHLPQSSDAEVEEEGTEAWTDDSEEGGEPDSGSDINPEEGFERDNFVARGGYMEVDSKSVTSDPDVPVKIWYHVLTDRAIAMLDTPEPIKQLFKDLVAMFDTSSDPLRRGVYYAQAILHMGTKGKFLKQGKETFIKRALVFYKHVAEMEKESGRSDVPGTAASMILSAVLEEMSNFHAFIQTKAYHSLVKRSAQHKTIRHRYFDRLKDLRFIISCAEKHLGVGNLGKLYHAALGPHPHPASQTIALEPIWHRLDSLLDDAIDITEKKMNDMDLGFPELSEALHFGFFFRTLRDSEAVQHTLKRKRDEGLDQESSTPPITSGPALFHVDPSTFASIKELSYSSLAFETAEELRHWQERAYSRFNLMRDVWNTSLNDIFISLSYLVGVLTTFAVGSYQLKVYGCAEYVCELVVATIREAYESNPSDASRIRLCSALGAYAIVAVEAKSKILAVRAVEEAIALLHPLYINDSSKHMLLMTALKTSYSSALANLAPRELDAQFELFLLRKSIQVASQAIDLARSAVKTNPNDLESKNMLAYALKTKANVYEIRSQLCYKLQVRLAKSRDEVEAERARMGGTDDQIPLADKHIDAACLLEKMADRTLSDLDIAAALLEECIEVYRELAKEAKALFEPILAKAIHSAAEIYLSQLNPKPELCVAKFKEAIDMFERLSEHCRGYFDDDIERAKLDLAQRLRGP
ncbi:hypothetical protein A4X13_0g6656 [Tilletia indica]|uniref:Uncharacterized protein n=1 Tax=Tilletia indica TaxID=43049 RepID=A0A177TXM3_9BASI|nr:hypothetical protein A4X13_0g6656 [Tilletia indica]